MFRAYLALLMRRREFLLCFFFMTAMSLGLFLYFCLRMYGADYGDVLSADKLFIGRGYNNPLFPILQYMLPLIIVIPFCDIALIEKSGNIQPIILTRTSHVKYVTCQALVAGMASWIVVFVPFLLNFILCLVAFPLESINSSIDITGGITSGYYSTVLDSSVLTGIFTISPYLYNFVMLMLLSLFCGLCGMIVYLFSYYFKGNRILLMFAPFIFNNILIITSSITDKSISPLNYLFALSEEHTKLRLFLPIMFLVMLALVIVLIGGASKKLRQLK